MGRHRALPLCNGYWERIIDATAVKANNGDKAGIKKGMTYKGDGWVPPGQTLEKSDRVYIVEGIFHAIALHLAGFKAIASISASNFPWNIIDANTEKLITWVVALDNDPAAHAVIPKYLGKIRERRELCCVALSDHRDWDDVYRDGDLDEAFLKEAYYQGRLFTAESTSKLAYLLYLKRPASFYLMEFRSCLYSASVNQAELSMDLGRKRSTAIARSSSSTSRFGAWPTACRIWSTWRRTSSPASSATSSTSNFRTRAAAARPPRPELNHRSAWFCAIAARAHAGRQLRRRRARTGHAQSEMAQRPNPRHPHGAQPALRGV
ncbi:toprim domain-containing protein [Pseudomonas sp. 15A4]|uniref:toprim domain-containing protein n=1 Tax=Pseudomonas sp. 15A4 TaxID=2804761 RepID=UPI001F082742|nr:toprim domain-containing protein [Pseudomonas sp. 15A4]